MKLEIASSDFAEILSQFEMPEFGKSADCERETMRLETPWFRGSVQSVYNHEFHIVQHDMVAQRDLRIGSRLDVPCITFCFALEGNLRYRYSFMEREAAWHPGTANIWLNFPDTYGYSVYDEKRRYSLLDVMLSHRLVERMARLYPEALESLLQRYEQAQTSALFPMNKPFTPKVMEIVESLRNANLYGAAAGMFRDAKIMELLGTFLILPSEERKRSVVMPKDYENLRHAREILLTRMQEPPSLVELAHLAGINEFKLKKGFKELFGTTVYGELLRHRMGLATRYLNDTNKSVAEIALLCGYTHLSHFSTAFKKDFGVSPLEYRKKVHNENQKSAKLPSSW